MPGFMPGIHVFFLRRAVRRSSSSCARQAGARELSLWDEHHSSSLEIDAGTDARLTEMAAERGQDVATVLAEAVALLDSVVELAGPDVAEDRRRLDEFLNGREAVPLTDVKSWVANWDTSKSYPVHRYTRSDDRFFARRDCGRRAFATFWMRPIRALPAAQWR